MAEGPEMRALEVAAVEGHEGEFWVGVGGAEEEGGGGFATTAAGMEEWELGLGDEREPVLAHGFELGEGLSG